MSAPYERVTDETLSDEMIDALSMEAGEHGDSEMVETCRLAMAGDADHREICVRVINNARAMA